MKIYDCFPFFNELDLLEIRLNELNNVVDYFVLVEAEMTHQNGPKPLYYSEVADDERFLKFKNKIIHVVIPAEEFNDNTSHNEKHQFSSVTRGITNADDDDLIMLSALDEIPKASTINSLKSHGITTSKVFKQNFYYFYLDTRYTEHHVDDPMFSFWNGTIIFPYKTLSTNNIYDIFMSRSFTLEKINDGGWHFSFMGDAQHAHTKLHSYLHPEFKGLTIEQLETFRNNLVDPLGRAGATEFIKFDKINELPNYVQENLNKYGKYIRQLN
jgi:beta-1,4-mannosyl-glycoprotein beta-1,4-N-acetylglucosaminyltransferase